MIFSFIDKINKLFEITSHYSCIIGFSFITSNLLYNKLTNKFGITIERMFDLQYIFLFFFTTKAILHII
mgnify:CR=1 FL=1|jgi:hypothetical protein|uniref:Uncharacterized protein n=1 Tax=viral metagenome TaxID=1070528 RepID=A0A6C0ELR6_9ZZZZ